MLKDAPYGVPTIKNYCCLELECFANQLLFNLLVFTWIKVFSLYYTFLKAFVTAYGQDFLETNTSQMLPIYGNGMQLGLEIFLSKSTFLEMTNSTPEYLSSKSFLIGINQNFNFFDMRTNNIRATLGHRTIIMLEPMELRYFWLVL